MRSRGKVALGAGIAVLSILLVLVLVPLLFGDRIERRLRTQVDASVNAHVDWRSASVGLIRDFPNPSLSLSALSIVGQQPFAGDTLAVVPSVRIALGLGSVVGFLRHGDPIIVREIVLDRPRLNLRVLPDGRANWDITKPSAAKPSSDRAVGVTLRDLRIRGATVLMEDRKSQLAMSIHGLDESLRGDFASEKFVLSTRTNIDSASIRFAGIPWLSRVALQLDADVDADLRAKRFTFRTDTLRLNQLLLAFAGSVTLGKPDVTLDLAFRTPGTEFRDILSLVPAVYARDFAKFNTAGSMSVSGRVRGPYGPHAFPALALRAQVKNGAFHDPSLPLAARGIFMDLAVDNPGGQLDGTVVNLQRLHLELGSRPVDARLVVRTPVSDPDIDFRLVGAVDLADVARTVKLADVSTLTGLVRADVAMRARLSDVHASRYDRVTASGSANASRVVLRAASLPRAIAVDTAAVLFTPRAAQLTTLALRAGNSDAHASVSLENLLGFALHGEDLRGSGSVTSTRFDLAEWQSKDKTTEVIPVPPRVDFTLAAAADRVTYGAIAMNAVHGILHVKDQRVSLDSLHMGLMGGTVVATGAYDTHDLARPGFDLALQLGSVDIPSSFAALPTVQKLAPIARWAKGSVSGSLAMKGLLAPDMTPVLSGLTGRGDLRTEKLVVQNAPVLEKLSSALSLDQLRSPALGAVRLAFDVADGRVHVKPFDVNAGGVAMTVGGSNGIDQSLEYDLALALPRTALGAATTSAVQRLAARAGSGASSLAAGQVVKLAAQVAGTVTNPTVSTSFAGMASSLADATKGAATAMASERVAEVKQKADSAAVEAQRKASAEAARILAQADSQAASIRAHARAVADSARRVASLRSDSLVARATNPAARFAAQAASDRLKREADQQADRAVREADAKAEGIVAEAKRRAGSVAPAAGTGR
ncbi:MAG TPA: AsmA-like C-terminal region-containing protein [Gemmatimonadaceae bacterium]|nr:AsmA-like C-terminal region-containing protein [Gemmatimonadaceae bacterium]